MKISELWLRDWITDLPVDSLTLVNQLTMAGLEVESVSQAAPKFTHVVVGEILEASPHPNADRLQTCKVDVGQDNFLNIVCGATNARVGLKAPVALVGAELPNGIIIKKAKLRNVESHGMLCSAIELGLAEDSKGLLELPSDAPIGTDFRIYYQLDDQIIDINITPNRGDCLSILGVAREIAAINHCERKKISPAKFKTKQETFPVEILAKDACPIYAGCVVKNINPRATTPFWMAEKLRRAGLKTIHPVVDITNFVMLELGQPLHAFDLNTLNNKIIVRYANSEEEITLLDDKTIQLNPDTLVIADAKNPLAIAGIMGGKNSKVDANTTDIFLESAFFTPQKLQGQARRYGIQTEASARFERGVDPSLQTIALNYAISLLIEIGGGEAGEIIKAGNPAVFEPAVISLPENKIEQVLGIKIAQAEITAIFKRLEIPAKFEAKYWQITVPPHRFDLNIAEDLIEEIARIYGYHLIPEQPIVTTLTPINFAIDSSNQTLTNNNYQRLSNLLVDKGYHETITYSFVDPKLQQLFTNNSETLILQNPISPAMSIMRTSMWPGLINVLLYNQNRKKNRMRLFEIGACFIPDDSNSYEQKDFLGGLVSGTSFPEQWGMEKNKLDFFDIKNDIETIFSILGYQKNIVCKNASHLNSGLHPQKSAQIFIDNILVGIIGEIHPTIKQKLEITSPTILFELDLSFLAKKPAFALRPVSKFPLVQRDIAIVIDKDITWEAIKEIIYTAGQNLLQDVKIFDVYYGHGIENKEKSIAVHLTLQHESRTLVDEEIESVVKKIVAELEGKFNAKLRAN